MVINELHLVYVNLAAPYHVEKGEVRGSYEFATDSGVEIGIGFMEDDLITSDVSYQFIISNLNNKKSPRDPKLKETILAIIEGFFTANQAALLYICDTGDGRQNMRSRLFEYWFAAYTRKNQYMMLSTCICDEEGNDNYATVIVRKDNPRLSHVLNEFAETAKLLDEKPRMRQ